MDSRLTTSLSPPHDAKLLFSKQGYSETLHELQHFQHWETLSFNWDRAPTLQRIQNEYFQMAYAFDFS